MACVSNDTDKIEEIVPLYLGNMHNIQVNDVRRILSINKYGDFPDDIMGMV